MPSYGNATIGEQPSPSAGNRAVQIPIATNQMALGVQAGMLNAHVGQNSDLVEPDPARAELLASQDTPGLSRAGAFIKWDVPTGTWVPET